MLAPPAPSAPTDSKREAILAAALQLMSERTFHGCAVPLIAAEAGVATGTIYRYFPSKEALANAVYQRWKGELGRRLLAETTTDGVGARAAFHQWWDGLSRFAAEQPEAFAFLELHHHEPYLDDDSRAVAYEIDAAAVATIEAGQREGAIRPGNPALLVAMVFGAFCGIVRAQQTHGALLGPDALLAAAGPVWDSLATPSTQGDRP